MKVFSKMVLLLMNILKVIGLISLALVMLIITLGVLFRFIGSPLVGEIESAEILYFVLIMASFSYAQFAKAHISVGILVDRFPKKFQLLLDIVSYIITMSVCMLLSFIIFTESLQTTRTSLLLGFPYSVLKTIAACGFFTWGLVSIIQITVKELEKNKEVVENG